MGEHLDHTHTRRPEVGHHTHPVREELASSIIQMYMLPAYCSLPHFARHMERVERRPTAKVKVKSKKGQKERERGCK